MKGQSEALIEETSKAVQDEARRKSGSSSLQAISSRPPRCLQPPLIGRPGPPGGSGRIGAKDEAGRAGTDRAVKEARM